MTSELYTTFTLEGEPACAPNAEEAVNSMINKLYYARERIMIDIFNRYENEIADLAMHQKISNHIVEVISQQQLQPGNCDLTRAAQCFTAAIMLKRSVPNAKWLEQFMEKQYTQDLAGFIGEILIINYLIR